MATYLKDPPAFVTNIGAWEYTLAKLATLDEEKPKDKPRLDEGGNPTNYGQAVAIYKAVCKKYPAFATNNVAAQPMMLRGTDANTVAELDDIFPVGEQFWYDDVLLEAVGHPNIAVFSDPEGKLLIWGRVISVDEMGQHKNLPEGRHGGWPPHRCVPFMEGLV
jgi:hypothetical protein